MGFVGIWVGLAVDVIVVVGSGDAEGSEFGYDSVDAMMIGREVSKMYTSLGIYIRGDLSDIPGKLGCQPWFKCVICCELRIAKATKNLKIRYSSVLFLKGDV
ncbi:hypothetical protein Tco_0319705 [Tanacetum coccineum]